MIPLSFVIAGVFLLIGLAGLLLGIMALSSMPAPSVQGGGVSSGMGCWFVFWLILALIAFASHWAHWPRFVW